MRSRTVTFNSREWLRKTGENYQVAFKYSIVDTVYRGQADEANHTNDWSIKVTISRSLTRAWNLHQEADLEKLEKVMYKYAWCHIRDKISNNTLNESEEVKLTGYCAPSKCPYDPDEIVISLDHPFDFPVSRPLGFRSK